MNIIAVDNESIALKGLLEVIREAAPKAEIKGFEFPEDALAFVQFHECSIAFLNADMPKMAGLKLAQRLKHLYPKFNIIFFSGNGELLGEAWKIHASGYVSKPLTAEKLRRELLDLRYPVPPRNRVRVQAFGNFEAYIDGRPVLFKYSKTKELLACLIDRRGALCSSGELLAKLFESEGHETYLKSLRRDLLETFNEMGCGDVIERQWGKLGVATDKIDCDYYDYLSDAKRNVVWRGEYMVQYSWSEYTAGILERISAKKE